LAKIVKIVFDVVIVALLLVDLVSEISVSLHFVAHFISVVVHGVLVLSDHWLFKSELVLQTELCQLEQNCAHTFSETGLQLVRWHVNIDVKFLELQNDILGGSHWVIVLVPPLHLVVVDGQHPSHERNEVHELVTWVRVGLSEVHSGERLKTFLLNQFVLVVE
jgi:hypothetical protein